jgi:response regulator of citrate/malate metabolism
MKQFTEEYERVTADPKLRDEHALYVMECMRQNGMKRMAKQEGLEQGLEQGIEISTLKSLRTLMETLSLSADEAMNALKLSDVEKLHYKELI